MEHTLATLEQMMIKNNGSLDLEGTAITFIDLFSGIGGARHGLESAKRAFQCVGHCEIDKYANASYRKMYDTKGEWYSDDIRRVHANDIPRAELWTAGFPCQDFSIAGKREGLEGTRSGLFYEITRIIRELPQADRPKWLLLENVKGLFSSDNGRDLYRILSELDAIGYDVEWQLVNSSQVVAQNRERIFLAGYLRGANAERIFFQNKVEYQEQTLLDVIEPVVDVKYYVSNANKENLLTEWKKQLSKKKNYPQKGLIQLVAGSQGNRIYSPTGKSVTLASEAGGLGAKTGLYAFVDLSKQFGTTEKTRTLTTKDRGIKNRAGESSGILTVHPVATPDRTTKHQNGRRFKEHNEEMFTLTTQDIHGILLTNPECIEIRKLTPLECFRLQGFTDELFYKARSATVNGKTISDSQLYKMAGNAITATMVTAIAGE